MRNTACAALLLAFMCNAGLALAGEGAPATSELGRNAALTYWRAFAASPEMTKEELNIISPPPGTEPKASPEKKAELVDRWRTALALMHEAADIPQCDWGIDYEKDGPWYAQMPHLSKARTLARAAAFRANYLWEKGQRKDALDDLHATLILARQVGNDGRDTVIAMLVQIGIEQIVQRTTAHLLTDRETADIFADALRDFDNGSTILLSKNAILAEKTALIPWLRREFASQPDFGKRLVHENGYDASDASPEQKEAAAKLRQLQQGDALKLLDELGRQFDELADITLLPYLEVKANWPAMLKKIKSSENPFSELMLPDLILVRAEDEKVRIKWAMVRAAIEFRREGEAGLSKVVEPPGGKPFLYTALEGGAFELKSAMQVRERDIVMTFGRPPAKKD